MSDPPSFTPPPENTHPYGVRMYLLLGSDLELELDKALQLPFVGSCVLTITRFPSNPREEAAYLKRINIDLDAFSSASEAERAGRVLTSAVLWVAASKRVTVGFRKRTGDYPFAVKDRTVGPGMTMEAEVITFSNVAPQEFVAIARGAYQRDVDVSPKVLTSMEFYAAASLETTEQARFINLMTALEALSDQHDNDNDIAQLLNDLATQLENASIFAEAGRESMKNSLGGRLRQLRKESVRQAIKRTVSEYLGDPEVGRFVDNAYGVRSKLLHEGVRNNDLYPISNRMTDILRQIHASILELPLARPPQEY